MLSDLGCSRTRSSAHVGAQSGAQSDDRGGARGVSCFCGHTHTSFAEALACSKRLQGSRNPRPGNNTQTLGVRSGSAHHHSMSQESNRVTSRLMGRRLAPVGELARNRARTSGQGLLRTTLSGGRPSLSPEERRRRARDRQQRSRASRAGVQRGTAAAPTTASEAG